MWQIRPGAHTATRPTDAERAGFAWACSFSSSAEFEAAVLSSRLRAGAFRWLRLRRYAVYLAVLAAAAAATASTHLPT